jgi:hypothetical protein
MAKKIDMTNLLLAAIALAALTAAASAGEITSRGEYQHCGDAMTGRAVSTTWNHGGRSHTWMSPFACAPGRAKQLAICDPDRRGD